MSTVKSVVCSSSSRSDDDAVILLLPAHQDLWVPVGRDDDAAGAALYIMPANPSPSLLLYHHYRTAILADIIS